MKKIILLFITILMLAVSGCSETADIGSETADMPDIVFTVFTAYNRSEQTFEDNPDMCRYSLTLLDKNGNYYWAEFNESFYGSDEELVEMLNSGDERIMKLSKSCNADELRENYKKLLKAAANKKCELDYPEALPDVEADSTTWYGLYYDDDGKIVSLPIHANRCMTGINSTDKNANEVYEWYSGAAKIQEDK